MREDRRALDLAVAVDGVDAVEHRDPEPRRQRLALEAVVHLDPRRRVVRLGQRVGAGQHRAEQEVVDLRAVLQRLHVGLGHLADLLVERHLREQRLDVGRRRAGLARGGDVGGGRHPRGAWPRGRGAPERGERRAGGGAHAQKATTSRKKRGLGTLTAVALNTNERRLTRLRIGVCNARQNRVNWGHSNETSQYPSCSSHRCHWCGLCRRRSRRTLAAATAATTAAGSGGSIGRHDRQRRQRRPEAGSS